MSTPLWNKKLPCPFCGKEFETTRLRASAQRVKEKWSDFGNLYEGDSPYFYAVTACPHCLVAARNEEFEKFNVEYEPKLVEFSKRGRLAANKPDIFKPGTCSAEIAIKRLELALACQKMRGHVELAENAGLILHMVWIHRTTGNQDLERAALNLAVEAYKEFFEKGNKLPEKLGEPGVLYLIGELYRRLGDTKQARLYFGKGLTSKDLEAFPNIESQLREQMMLAKEQSGS